MTWTDGYHAASAYTHGYYRQTNPVFARCLLTLAGYAVRDIHTACELGYGHGVSVAMHAAASGTAWWGTDFIPAQAEYAQALAGESAVLAEQGFEEFCARTDLPEFDFVCAHGIWSWVSQANRSIIVDFLRRKLRPGGVFYVSYNTETGWGSLRPFRDLLRRYVMTQSPPGVGPERAISSAVTFMRRVFDAQSVYARQNPLALAMLDKIAGEISAYHAHEFLGAHWTPLNVADLASELAGAKLTLASSAAVVDHIPGLDLLASQRAALDEIDDPGFRETARELLRGTRFRREYWIKGGQRMSPAEENTAIAGLRFVLTEPREAVTQVCPSTHAGDISLPIAAFDPLLDAMADHRPYRLGDLAAALGPLGLSPQDVRHAVLTLTEVGAVQPAHAEDRTIEAAFPTACALNARLLRRAWHDGAVGHLANPVTGGAMEVPRAQQLLLSKEALGDLREKDGEQEWETTPAQLQAAATSLAAGKREMMHRQRVVLGPEAAWNVEDGAPGRQLPDSKVC